MNHRKGYVDEIDRLKIELAIASKRLEFFDYLYEKVDLLAENAKIIVNGMFVPKNVTEEEKSFVGTYIKVISELEGLRKV
jgi:hypothetical protein